MRTIVSNLCYLVLADPEKFISGYVPKGVCGVDKVSTGYLFLIRDGVRFGNDLLFLRICVSFYHPTFEHYIVLALPVG